MRTRFVPASSLATRHIKEVRTHDSVPSTNELALALADDPARHGVAILARHQSAGRGQHGRSWLAPPESSVLLSVLLFLPEEARRPALLTAWAAVSVSEAVLGLTGRQARIKWPNDVYLDGKKVSGILIEQRSRGSDASDQRRTATVVGVGLNVTQPASFFAEAGLPLGGSLASQTGLALPWEAAACELLETLDRRLDAILAGNMSSLEASWQCRLGLLGQRVRAETVNSDVDGTLVELTFDRVAIASGEEILTLPPESVRQLTVHPPGSDEHRA